MILSQARGRRQSDMTVCIAAICTLPQTNRLMIVGASDRMLSAPDLKFEPPQRKIYTFYPWAVALVAGDPYLQIGICEEVSRALRARSKAPDTVEEIARMYAEAFTLYRRRAAENKYLKPLGLDANSFLDRMIDFQPGFVAEIRNDMQRSALEAETIIAGTDNTGPHIFMISDPGDVACADGLAFASIGSGKFHSDWQFMMAGYTRAEPVYKALLLTYLA